MGVYNYVINYIDLINLTYTMTKLTMSSHTLTLAVSAYCTSVLFGKENGVLKFLRESATLEEVS